MSKRAASANSWHTFCKLNLDLDPSLTFAHDTTVPSVDACVARLSDARVAVFGHPVLDCYLYGVTHRISREAPVLIVREESRSVALGGAGNTAANLSGLGAKTYLVGPIGDDSEAQILENLCKELGIDAQGLVRGACDVTLSKTRVLAGGLHTTRQQMLRIDREGEGPPSSKARAELHAAGDKTLHKVNAVVVSDYGDRELTELWQAIAARAISQNLPVVVDSRHALLEFEGVTAVTPNEPEAEAALGRQLRTTSEAERAAMEIRDRLGARFVLLTRGRHGMIVAQQAHDPTHIPAFGGEAVDVTGAGDTVAATLAAALATQAEILTAAHLANYAASIVVQKTGTAPISLQELKALLVTSTSGPLSDETKSA